MLSKINPVLFGVNAILWGALGNWIACLAWCVATIYSLLYLIKE
jgi:hypothetical protein